MAFGRLKLLAQGTERGQTHLFGHANILQKSQLKNIKAGPDEWHFYFVCCT
jgi:hypothetical protein